MLQFHHSREPGVSVSGSFSVWCSGPAQDLYRRTQLMRCSASLGGTRIGRPRKGRRIRLKNWVLV